MTYRCADLLSRIAEVVASGRAADPTAPAIVLVSTGSEVQALKLSLARSDLPVVHVGVQVQTINNAAAQLAAIIGGSHSRLAEPFEVSDSVRRASQDGYFKTLSGLRGVTFSLEAAMALWDCADQKVRDELLATASRLDADRHRLAGLVALHAWVSQDLAQAGLSLPGTMLAQPIDPRCSESFTWIDCTLNQPNPAQRDWLDRLAEPRAVRRVDPADSQVANQPDGIVVESIVSSVDPADEAILAARRVTAALEAGTAARDIVVAVAGPETDRYFQQIGSALAAAHVPNDHGSRSEDQPAGDGSSTLLWDTSTGRVLAALFDAVTEVREPGDLRMDHLRFCAEGASLLNDDGTELENLLSRIKTLWKQTRGTDPAQWGRTLGSNAVDGSDPDAAAMLRDFANAIVTMSAAQTAAVTWGELGQAMLVVLDRVRATSKADAACQQRLRSMLTVWQSRSDSTTWSQAREDVTEVLGQSWSDPGGGVRLVDLGTAWAMFAEAAIVCGLADDQLPGVQGPIGPLTAEEALRLRSASDDVPAGGGDGRSWLAALIANSARVWLSFPRSDQLRTTKRERSRYLDDLPSELAVGDRAGPREATVREVGSIGSHYRLVDSGELGLLGKSDAAAAMLRSGTAWTDPAIANLITIDLGAAVACARSRREPGIRDFVVGAFDEFNGDVRSVAREFPEHFSPDFHGKGDAGASPSATESLLGCPISWWAQRMIKISESGEWDPPVMDALAYGSWLHASFEKLSRQHKLLDEQLDQESIEQTLWDAVGGRPDGSAPNSESESDGLTGFRYRLTDQEIQRAARAVGRAAKRLRNFLAGLDGSLSAVEERGLGPTKLPLGPGPPLWLRGRVDRIDGLADGSALVTDFKTGRAGSGFQLAVYAWLQMISGDAESAQLLYATTHAGPYKAVDLDVGDTLLYDEPTLRTYLVDRLEGPVEAARQGIFPSTAGFDEHDRYCPLCGDRVAAEGSFGSGNRADRALALANIASKYPDTATADVDPDGGELDTAGEQA